MEWIILLVLLSGAGNFWQYGNNKTMEASLVLANREASACQAVQQASRATDIEAANEREQATTNIGRILAGSEYNARGGNQVGTDSCSGIVSTTGSERVEIIIKRTRALNNAWMHSTRDSDDY